MILYFAMSLDALIGARLVVGFSGAEATEALIAQLRALMERHGAAASDTVFIGDSPVDVEAGRRAGVLTVAMTHGLSDAHELDAAAPDETVKSFSALQALAVTQRW